MKTLTNINPHVAAWRCRQLFKPVRERVFCENWAPSYPRTAEVSEYLGGRVIGTLQPVDYEAVRRNPDLQSRSRG